MLIELLVFDCDGTLVYGNDIKAGAYGHVGSLISKEAEKAMLAWYAREVKTPRRERFAWLYQEFLGRELDDAEFEKLSKIFHAYSMGKLCNAPLVPGALETLRYWQGRLPMCVASAAPTHELREMLTGLGLAVFFQDFYGSPPHKPELLRQAIHNNGACGLSTIMIGDSQADYEAAEYAGTYFYGVGPGMEHCSRSDPLAWGNDLTGFNAWLEDQLRQ